MCHASKVFVVALINPILWSIPLKTTVCCYLKGMCLAIKSVGKAKIFQNSRAFEVCQGGSWRRRSWSSSSLSELYSRLWCWAKFAQSEGAETEPWTRKMSGIKNPPFLDGFIPPIKRWFWGWIGYWLVSALLYNIKIICSMYLLRNLLSQSLFLLLLSKSLRLRLIWRRPHRYWDAGMLSLGFPNSAGELPLVMSLGKDSWPVRVCFRITRVPRIIGPPNQTMEQDLSSSVQTKKGWLSVFEWFSTRFSNTPTHTHTHQPFI